MNETIKDFKKEVLKCKTNKITGIFLLTETASEIIDYIQILENQIEILKDNNCMLQDEINDLF